MSDKKGPIKEFGRK